MNIASFFSLTSSNLLHPSFITFSFIDNLMVDPAMRVILPAIGISVISFVMGILIQLYITKQSRASAKSEADRIIEEAEREAETIKKEARWEGKEEIEQRKEEIDKEYEEKKARLEEREQELQQKEDELEERLEEVYEEANELKERRQKLEEREDKVKEKIEEAKQELERISGMTADEARELLREQLMEEARERSEQKVRKIEAEAEDEAEAKARRIIARALQRCAVEQTTESTVQVVDLPSDDMKGRIIGREGRNIRAFEKTTGVDLIVDDTPEAVSISCFDPVRRELAKNTLEKLILDGRIQPARIEEIHEKTKREFDEEVMEIGEEALSEVGIPGVADELVERLGRLNYIIEAGQNQLEHSIQVAQLAGLLATEMGGDAEMARRCGILHAIGKTEDHQNGQSYALAGASLAEKYNEPDPVVYAIASHNEERPFKTVEGIITHVAYQISVNRPGARKDKFENFINRLENLEELAQQFNGVEEAFAIQSGRELRVIVDSDNVDDSKSEYLARDIADSVQEEIDFPDQIKVSLLREKRVIDFAR
ncbi:MAG: ribonuclease Y [bacterium]